MMSSTMVDTGVNRVDSFLKVCKRGLQVMASDQGYEFHLFPPQVELLPYVINTVAHGGHCS